MKHASGIASKSEKLLQTFRKYLLTGTWVKDLIQPPRKLKFVGIYFTMPLCVKLTVVHAVQLLSLIICY